jgi:parvulin-like peptidyl-prolyl isomerase
MRSVRPQAVLLASLFLSAAAAAQVPVASHATGRSATAAVREVARVNGVSLGPDRLDAALRALVPLESFHRNVSPDRMAALRSTALQSVIDEELQYQEGVRLNLTASDAEVDATEARAARAYRGRKALDEARRRAGVSLADFRREIRRTLTIEHAREHEVTGRCQVDAEQAARFYAENPGRFVVPEQLHLQVITIGVDPGGSAREWAAAKTTAGDVVRQLRAGASFEQLAATHSTDPSRSAGGDMGLVHRGSLSDEFEKATSNMKTGDVSDVVPSLYGYHIVRLAGVKPPERKALAEVASDIRKDLTAKRCGEMNQAWLAALRARASVVIGTDPATRGAAPAHSPGRRP